MIFPSFQNHDATVARAFWRVSVMATVSKMADLSLTKLANTSRSMTCLLAHAEFGYADDTADTEQDVKTS